MTNNKTILLVGSKGPLTNIVFNAINKQFGIHVAIMENKEPKSVFLRRRIKLLGLSTVIGQIFFQCIIVKGLSFFSTQRTNEIIAGNKLDANNIPNPKLKLISSINASNTIELIKSLQPDLIIVSGTRIISKKVLQSTNAKFINIHTGITPKYRGVHGGYWALANNDIANAGVTVHFIDEGIDTGNIIEQGIIIPTSKDNFTTYPLLQTSLGIQLLNTAIENFFNNNIVEKQAEGQSKIYYHPTIWQYIFNRVVKGIK